MITNRFFDGFARFEDARCGVRIITVCKGRADGKSFYSFVGIEPQNLMYFLQHYRENALSDFRVFGRELLRGWGEDPPEAIREHVRVKYDVDFVLDESRMIDIAKITASLVRERKLPADFPLLSFNPQNTREATTAF